jgi:excisionase family DNA binding protein
MQGSKAVFFAQTFGLVDQDPFELIASLIIETFRNEALQDALVHKTAPKEPAPAPEPKPAQDSLYMAFSEACTYLRLTDRQLKDLCRDQGITHARFDYRTYRFRKADLDEWFDAYKVRRKSVYD